MAKPEHVEIVKQGKEAIDVWRRENPDEQLDLFGATLIRASLKGASLKGADLNGADLRDAFLIETDLSYVNLSNADLSGANLSSAVLNGADLNGAKLFDAELIEADLSFLFEDFDQDEIEAASELCFTLSIFKEESEFERKPQGELYGKSCVSPVQSGGDEVESQ